MKVSIEEIKSAISGSGMLVDVESMNGADSLKDAGVDSLESMSLFLALEEKFGVKFPDEDIDSLDTFDSIISYMEKF